MSLGEGTLYDQHVGRHDEHEVMFTLLQKRHPFDPGRYRDCWLERHDGSRIFARLHTKNGDRLATVEQIEAGIVEHPWFDHRSVPMPDEDPTYVDYYFAVDLGWVADQAAATGQQPDTILNGLRHFVHLHPFDVSAQWAEASADADEQHGFLHPDAAPEPTLNPRGGES